MALPAEALDLIKRFEGYLRLLGDGSDRVRPYWCPAHVATIGWGTTRYPNGRRVEIDDPPIDKATATIYLESELREDEAAFDRLTTARLSPLSRGALVSFVYNCGSGAYRASTLRKRVNEMNWAAVPGELRKWRLGGGRVLPGLVRRREAEIELFNKGLRYEPSAPPELPPVIPTQPPSAPSDPGPWRSGWRRIIDWILK